MLDKIVSIEKIGKKDTIDIEVSGDHLFFANDILTHNSSSDLGLENTSDSIGLPMTVDLMLALIATEELDELGQIMVNQLKNRFGDPNINKRFVIGVDRAKMRLYNVEQSAQEEILDGPVFEGSKFGEEEEERKKPKKKFNKDKFKGFL
jgi:hypothetical protein